MKICAYVQTEYAKQTYSKESFNVRLFAGMAVTIDILKRAGHEVSYAGIATVHNFDVVLVSMTSDCDWWNFIKERTQWQNNNCKVIIGGQGVLNVRPFLPFADYFVLGRAEGIIAELVTAIDKGTEVESQSVIESTKFNINSFYAINQTNKIYPYDIKLENGDIYHEDVIGCNHRCLFCGYTWQRNNVQDKAFELGADNGLWNGGKDRERAMIDMDEGIMVDLNKLRTTAIDGLSEKLRFMVNKKITREMLRNFLDKLFRCQKPHQVKFFNIIGYPNESIDDWYEFIDDIKQVDSNFSKQQKQTCILLHSTPFRAMPATPLACKPMSYKNYRGEVGRVLGKGLKGNIFYQGNTCWAVEGMGTEGLSTVTKSAIVWRGTENDTEAIVKLARSNKYWSASSGNKQATLEKYFDVKTLFGAFDQETLPTKYLKTYCNVENMWSKL